MLKQKKVSVPTHNIKDIYHKKSPHCSIKPHFRHWSQVSTRKFDMITTIARNGKMEKKRLRKKLRGPSFSQKVSMAQVLQEVNRLPLKKRPYRQFNKESGNIEFPEFFLKHFSPPFMWRFPECAKRSTSNDSETTSQLIQNKSNAEPTGEEKGGEIRELVDAANKELQTIDTPQPLQKRRRISSKLMETGQVKELSTQTRRTLLFSDVSDISPASVMKLTVSSSTVSSLSKNTDFFNSGPFFTPTSITCQLGIRESQKRDRCTLNSTPSIFEELQSSRGTSRTSFQQEEKGETNINSISIRLDQEFESPSTTANFTCHQSNAL